MIHIRADFCANPYCAPVAFSTDTESNIDRLEGLPLQSSTRTKCGTLWATYKSGIHLISPYLLM
jgi:hypothetical protein